MSNTLGTAARDLEIQGYKIIRFLGRGATASVYSATSDATGEKVALKIFSAGRAESASHLPAREIRALRTLQHPNVVALLGTHLEMDPPALCFQLVEGRTLAEFQSRLPFVLPELSVRIAIEILSALEHAHEQKVIHRDLKPSNVLISDRGDVLVTDFGLAKLSDGGSVTATGTLLGSPEYMSPEQAEGDLISSKSDLFSVSSILYFLVTGAPPFSRGSSLATLSAVSRSEFESPEKRNPKISPALSRLICRGLEKNPDRRYASAREFRVTLCDYLESVGLHVEDFTLGQWQKDPSTETLRALKQMSESLHARCENEILKHAPDQAYETLAHLSLVAPSSQSVQRLAPRISSLQRDLGRKEKLHQTGRVLLVTLFVGALGAAGFIYYGRSKPIQPVAQPTPLQASALVEKPIVEKPAEPEKVVPKIAVPQKPAAAKKEKVVLDLPSTMQVFWDGSRVASQGNFPASLGHHRLRLALPGMKPLEQDIKVVSGEPTVIRVGSGRTGERK